MNNKYNRLNTEINNSNSKIMNNTISDFKLNISKNSNKNNKKILKPSLKGKEIIPFEKMKNSKNIIKNKNRKNKIGFGDSYEFNFTFNNYNNNFTQNNINNSEFKNSNKKKNKNLIENLANKTMINDFNSVRNNILNDIKSIINKNKDKKENIKTDLKQNSKIGKIGVIRKNKKKNNDIYAIKIQKLFRGYIFRKNNHYIKRLKEKTNPNSGVYIRKKILNKKNGLRLNIKDNFVPTKQREYNFTETNLTNSKNIENNINNITQQNKIEEIIIDKNKLFNVLGPSTKRKESNDMKLNNGYKFDF